MLNRDLTIFIYLGSRNIFKEPYKTSSITKHLDLKHFKQ